MDDRRQSGGVMRPGIAAAGQKHGGGAPPPWLPSGARSFLDFKAAHYYASGAVQFVTTLLGADAGFGTTFTTADISTNDGLAGVVQGGSSRPQIIGPLLSDMLGSGAGSTIIIEGTGVTLSVSFADSSNFNTELDIYAQQNPPTPSQFYNNVTTISFSGNTLIHDPTDQAVNKAGFTLIPEQASISTNGATPETSAFATGLWGQVAAALIANDFYYIYSITVYPPKQGSNLSDLTA